MLITMNVNGKKVDIPSCLVNQSDIAFNPLKGVINDFNGNVNGYIDTNFIPRTHAIHSTLNDTSLGAFVYDSVSIGNVIGFYPLAAAGGGNSLIKNIINNYGVRVNTGGSNTSVADTTTENRLVCGVRTNATQALTYLNGVLKATTTQNSSTVPNVNMLVLMNNAEVGFSFSGYASGEVAFFYHGSGAINQANLNTFVGLLLL
nr:hypothetical protein [uncultured Flavobacterium sp.]